MRPPYPRFPPASPTRVTCACVLSGDPDTYVNCQNCDQDRYAYCDVDKRDQQKHHLATQVVRGLALCDAHAIEDSGPAVEMRGGEPGVSGKDSEPAAAGQEPALSVDFDDDTPTVRTAVLTDADLLGERPVAEELDADLLEEEPVNDFEHDRPTVKIERLSCADLVRAGERSMPTAMELDAELLQHAEGGQ